MKKVDVVVVGGGPVGLWTACELKLAGLDVAVLERRIARTDQSRALTIHGRTVELFAMRGIADRFLAEGKPIPTGHYAALDTRLDFSSFDTQFPFTLFLAQSRTEALIEDHARELGVEFLRGHMVESITGDAAEGYQLSARQECGVSVFGARAVVGADARHSIVRRTAGIAFEGSDATVSIMMGDVRLKGANGPPVRTVSNERGGVTIVPVGPGGVARVIVIDPRRMRIPVGEPLSLEELASSTRQVLGEDVQLSDPTWLSRFGDETRLAARYREGNLFLAGDAAHLHLPAGGQGMNVGLQDAMNLGWKLAAVLNGVAPDALLDSYQKERRPVGAQLARNTLAQGAVMTGFDLAHLALRAEMSELLELPEVNRRLAGVLSGFDLRYLGGDLFGDALGVGERVADRALRFADGTYTSIYRLLSRGKWLHLSCQSGMRMPLPEWLHPQAVDFVSASFAGLEVRDDSVAACLIRPDGYNAGHTIASGVAATNPA
ncbi:FAD-dependent oxidoreductase [Sphingopyxis terrae]|uniref:FAD-dependent oxidoreductase n=1 Tax=Sphingopyxis terrae TaxID=33052 RepID=UPI000788004B|nr:FAD-dependent oxidoreductase [Sphingopyxis terrae]